MALSPARRLLAALTLAVLLSAAAGQALAQTSLDDPLDDRSAKRLERMEKVVRELRAVVYQGRETGQPVVVQPADTQSRLASVSDHLNDLEQTLAKFNGELEVVRHDLDQARQEAADLRAGNADLKARLAALEKTVEAFATPPPPPPPEGSAEPRAAQTEDPAATFAAGKAAFVAGDMAAAEPALRDYVDRHGDGPSGPEARYYLARVLLARRAWADAASADIGAIRGWPQTRWAPQAVLDLSRALIALKKPADACQTLDELIRRYPKAQANVQKAAVDLRTQAKCF